MSLSGLTVSFASGGGRVRAVEDVGFELVRGETLGLVGESGCGKSVTSLSLLGLLDPDVARVESGAARLGEVDLLRLSERELSRVRGAKVAMIFQEPMTSLNPVYSVGAQIGEAIRLHRDVSRKEARARAISLLSRVKIPAPEARVDAYPHELSGGMRQRVMIAMALACEPEVLIADEPTTALDVTIQAEILALLSELQRSMGMAILLVTHDLGVVAEVASRVVVMYAGRVVERAPVEALFARPLHPYAAGLFRSIPPIGASQRGEARRRLPTIEGVVPSLRELPRGCRFEPRCPERRPRCAEEEPPLTSQGERDVRCHFPLA
ncbi:MAG: ABC transporter ATP-binding protein [Polyangiaceae bacterium]|nr:ABC transporter ATP-binding protein [Polyangiaceae bacterium]